MLTYKYQAMSKDGAKINGVMEAHNEYEAIAFIKENCSIIYKIKESKSAEASSRGGGKVSDKSLAMVCSQFAIITKAGLPVVRAVELIAHQTADKSLAYILEQVALDVSAGFSLSKSFENNGPQLPTTFIETIRSGEESGTLETAFARLHTYYDKSAKLRGKLISALTYPAFTIVVAIGVVILIMVMAVPTFTKSFVGMGVELPLPTVILIATSNFFTEYILLLCGLVAAGLVAYLLYNKTEKGALNIARMKLNLPVVGKLNLMKAASEYANTMATMLSAGLPMIQAVAVTGRAMTNYYLGNLLQTAVSDLESGRTLTGCMRRMPYFPELLVEMTGVGEETGTLESTLDVIGQFYDSETEIKSAQVLSMVEPIIICVLAVVVVGILLSVYLPMFSLYSGM